MEDLVDGPHFLLPPAFGSLLHDLLTRLQLHLFFPINIIFISGTFPEIYILASRHNELASAVRHFASWRHNPVQAVRQIHQLKKIRWISVELTRKRIPSIKVGASPSPWQNECKQLLPWRSKMFKSLLPSTSNWSARTLRQRWRAVDPWKSSTLASNRIWSNI